MSSVAVGAGNACFGRRRFGSTRESNFTRVVSSTVRFYQKTIYKNSRVDSKLTKLNKRKIF